MAWWMAWTAEGIHELTATGRKTKPSEELMCQWIGEAWRDIPREMVVRSFLKCGITNALDGSEDDCVFDSSSDDESILEDEGLVDKLFASDSEWRIFTDFEVLLTIIKLSLTSKLL